MFDRTVTDCLHQTQTTLMNTQLLFSLVPSKSAWADWVICDTGFLVNNQLDAPRFIRDDELSEINPNLPYVLRHLKRVRHQNYRIGVLRDLEHLNTMWSAPLCIKSSTHELVAIVTATHLECDKRALIITGCGMPYTNVPIEGIAEPVKLHTGAFMGTVRVSKTWMNKHYSGWENRLMIAEELGVNALSCLSYVFNLTAVPGPVIVPDDLLLGGY